MPQLLVLERLTIGTVRTALELNFEAFLELALVSDSELASFEFLLMRKVPLLEYVASCGCSFLP